ncbi:hypothetical protein LO762_12505 [Actinocorallia sp. API 0066]|uniref:hypothetical protein n=1 Tax=Actinocorallia sp. API 0066 TaxID=2896846 RepID=UPI001E54CFDC|nr:hypothetical protein [Actinocorallia sp. API 0066]MCD0450007.1 hypothetical protein [Actinocorallia sp. API 0066]
MTRQELTETSGPELWQAARTVEDIARFTLTDLMLDRREATQQIGALLLGVALTEPLEHWVLRGRPLPTLSRPGSVDEEEIRRIETTTKALRHWDRRFRMGIRRKAVVGQMNEVAQLLREHQAPDIARRLFEVLAELAKIAASMSYDAGLHPLAQRYYRLSLRAAHASGESGRLFGANILAAMARQMLDLGRPEDALDLIRLALDGVRTDAPGRVLSMLRTREGWAYAKTGRVQAFHRAVGQAEETFHEPVTTRLPYWITPFDASELAGVIGGRYRDLALAQAREGRPYTDLAQRSATYITSALELRAPRRLRNRAFDLIGLGRAHLLLNEREEAVHVIRQAVTIEDAINSGRVERRLHDFHRESARYKDSTEIADLRGELAERFRTRAATLKETA